MNGMNQADWNKVQAFELDSQEGEYDFTLRLAKENQWTISFTNSAVAEYKKFMYLAATSPNMVSPSPIVDVVWHQHLIFTQSYAEFCRMLGKQIEHIPSTHHKPESGKFKQAKERTKTLYAGFFGEWDKGIWEYNAMFESLNLDKAKYKLRSKLIFAILSVFIITPIFAYLLMPVFKKIDNPIFMSANLFIAILCFTVLEIYNRKVLMSMVKKADPSSFLYELNPYELVFLKTRDISRVIDGVVNELLENGAVEIEDKKLKVGSPEEVSEKTKKQVLDVLGEYVNSPYGYILNKLRPKPVFRNIQDSMEALRKYYIKSKAFSTLFFVNFTVFSSLFMMSGARIMTGFLRDKPVGFITLFTIVFTLFVGLFLFRLANYLTVESIPEMYRKELIPSGKFEKNWQWVYFVAGTAVLSKAFIPMTVQTNTGGTNSSYNNCGSSCGNSCGSSCSSCGGGGCGGCGGN